MTGVTNTATLTPFPEVTAFLPALLEGARITLGERLVAFYLSGSLALGDFMPHCSDIDFLAVTAGNLPGDVLQRLQERHRRLAASGSPWAHRVEGSYYPRKALRRYDASNATHPKMEAPEEYPAMKWHRTNTVIHRYIVREHGVVLFGLDPRPLIDPVRPAARSAGAAANLVGGDAYRPHQVGVQRLPDLRGAHDVPRTVHDGVGRGRVQAGGGAVGILAARNSGPVVRLNRTRARLERSIPGGRGGGDASPHRLYPAAQRITREIKRFGKPKQ